MGTANILHFQSCVHLGVWVPGSADANQRSKGPVAERVWAIWHVAMWSAILGGSGLVQKCSFPSRTGRCNPYGSFYTARGSKPGQHLPHKGQQLVPPARRSPGPQLLSMLLCQAQSHRWTPIFSCLKQPKCEHLDLGEVRWSFNDQCPPEKHIPESPLLTSPRSASCACPSPGWPPPEAPAGSFLFRLALPHSPVQLDTPASVPALRTSPVPLAHAHGNVWQPRAPSRGLPAIRAAARHRPTPSRVWMWK